MVSALLGFMAVSGLLGQRNLLRLSVRCRLISEAYAGLPAQCRLELSNRRKYLPAFLIRVAVGTEQVLFPLVQTGACREQAIILIFPVRGLHLLPELRVSSCFPINFFVRSRSIENDQRLLVFPRPLKSPLPTGSGRDHQARQDELSQPGIDGELRSIDDYLDGDPLKTIHWKHSARQEENYKVKRLTRLGVPAQLINFADLPGSLEEQLGRCTYLVNRLSKQQRAVGLRLDQQLIPPAVGNSHRCRMLTELACYDRR